MLDAVDAAGFVRATGNTAWWASDHPRVETFEAPGYQIFRPDFDALLLDCARAAGADVHEAVVRGVDLGEAIGPYATVEYDEHGRRETLSCRFVVDCSGRAGIVARRFRRLDAARMFGFVGVWRSDRQWSLPDASHTAVESFDDGWAWSVPTSQTTRHVGVMVGETGASYADCVAKTRFIRRLVESASLERTFACDASTYSSATYAGSHFLLAGDAGSFIDPLSSFGVKKALASAWLGAIAVHTSLKDPGRRDVALEFFSGREREMHATHAARSGEFARQAYEHHLSPFWESRSRGRERPFPPPAEGKPLPAPLQAVFDRLKAARSIDLQLADHLPLERRPVVRGREIVVEEALAGGLRFVDNVDLLTLARMAAHHRQVPDLFDAYCRDCSPAPLPSVVSGLSLLVAKGILHERT